MFVFGEFDFGAFCELEQIRARIDVLNWLYDPKLGLALPLVVSLLASIPKHLAASVAGVLGKLGPTLLGRKQGLGCLPGVVVRPDLAFQQHAVEAGFIRVALPLVAIEVVPARELVVSEAAGEPGARLPAREPLLVARLAGAPAEGQGGLPERSWLSVASHGRILSC